MRMDMRVTGPVGLSLSLLLAGCSGSDASPTCADARSAFGPVTPSGRAEVPLAEANVVFSLSSASARPQVVTVRADSTLFSVRLPPHNQDGCRPPLAAFVFSHPFDLPPHAVTLEATANGERSTLSLTPGPRKQWVVVQPQDDFPLRMTVQLEEPRCG